MVLLQALLASLCTGAPGHVAYRVIQIPVEVVPDTLVLGFTDSGRIGFTKGDRSFAWSAATGVRPLAPLPNAVGVRVTDMRENGEAIGYCWFASMNARAMEWSEDGTPRELRTPGAASFSSAAAVASDARVVGLSYDDTTGLLPVLWWHDVASILPLPVGFTRGAAYAVNNFGGAVGIVMGPVTNEFRPAVWTSPISSFAPDLPSGVTGGILQGLNDAGDAVGYGVLNGEFAPMRYGALGLELVDFPVGFDIGTLLDLNRDGTAIGHVRTNATNWRGVVSDGDQLELIDDLIDPVSGAGWTVRVLHRINDHGQIAAIGDHTSAPNEFAMLVLDPMP